MKFNSKNQIFQNIIFSLNIFFSVSLKYPHSLYLSNGNIFVIHETGITIYDHLFMNTIKDVLTFSGNDKIYLDEIAKITTTIEDDYIFSIIKDKIYIFDYYNGSLIFHNKTSILGIGIDPKYYSLVVIKNETNNLYKYVISYRHKYHLYNIYFKYNITSKENTFIGKFYLNCCNSVLKCKESNASSCQYMIDNDNAYLVCFAVTYHGFLDLGFFYLEGYSFNLTEEEIEYNTKLFTNDFGDINCIKSISNANHDKALISLYSSSGEMRTFIFDINSFKEINFIQNFKYIYCLKEYYSLYIYYNKYTNYYINSCLEQNKNFILVEFYDEDFNNNSSQIIEKDNGKYGYSILYSNCTEKYYLISDNKPFKPLFDDEEKFDGETIKKCLGKEIDSEDESDLKFWLIIIIFCVSSLIILTIVGHLIFKKCENRSSSRKTPEEAISTSLINISIKSKD